VKQFLAQKSKVCLIVKEDFRVLKRCRKSLTTVLKVVPKKEFEKCFQQWQYRWAKCIGDQGK
jgi:hypothetical protein